MAENDKDAKSHVELEEPTEPENENAISETYETQGHEREEKSDVDTRPGSTEIESKSEEPNIEERKDGTEQDKEEEQCKTDVDEATKPEQKAEDDEMKT